MKNRKSVQEGGLRVFVELEVLSNAEKYLLDDTIPIRRSIYTNEQREMYCK